MTGSLETAIRSALSGPGKKKMMDALDIDPSQCSRIMSGQAGITMGRLDAVVAETGFVLVTKHFIDCMAGLAGVGAACKCAREGGGVCGLRP